MVNVQKSISRSILIFVTMFLFLKLASELKRKRTEMQIERVEKKTFDRVESENQIQNISNDFNLKKVHVSLLCRQLQMA